MTHDQTSGVSDHYDADGNYTHSLYNGQPFVRDEDHLDLPTLEDLEDQRQLLDNILVELKKMNFQLTIMTDCQVNDTEVE